MRFALTALFASSIFLGAHDMYILPADFHPAKGSRITAAFHVGDSFPESEVSLKLERLRDPKILWKGGQGALTHARLDGNRTLADGTVGGNGEIILAAQTLPNLIELAPEKFEAYLKEEGLADVIEWRAKRGEARSAGKERYSKYAKSILLSRDPDGFAMGKVGYVIEIIPEADPYKVKPGGSLPVRVLFRGKPAAGLQVESTWVGDGPSKTVVVGRTVEDGRIQVPLQNAGRWRIHTIKMERCRDAAVADWESFWATVTFDLR